MNYWYVARPNELFLDIDNVSRSIKHARSRLQGAIECGKLNVSHVMQRPSKSKDHLHVIITLGNSKPKSITENAVWEIVLHGDIYRGCCTIMRVRRGMQAPSILISPWATFADLHADNRRPADDKCECENKHNATAMETCPAAIRLRGDNRNAGFFGKPSKNPCIIWPDL